MKPLKTFYRIVYQSETLFFNSAAEARKFIEEHPNQCSRISISNAYRLDRKRELERLVKARK